MPPRCYTYSKIEKVMKLFGYNWNRLFDLIKNLQNDIFWAKN